jgi:hypothetical protein
MASSLLVISQRIINGDKAVSFYWFDNPNVYAYGNSNRMLAKPYFVNWISEEVASSVLDLIVACRLE